MKAPRTFHRQRVCLFSIALVAAALSACGPDKKTQVLPRINLPLESGAPKVAYLPGTEFEIAVSWIAWCTYNGGLPDTSTTKPCDEQRFLARLEYDGPAGDVMPRGVSAGSPFTGQGTILVRPSMPGDFKIRVEIENMVTRERRQAGGQIAIRDLERVVIDCVYQPFDPSAPPRCENKPGYVLCRDVPTMPCPTTARLDPIWGTDISIWIYGQGGGFPIHPVSKLPWSPSTSFPPQVAFTGAALSRTDYARAGHADPRAAPFAEKFATTVKAPVSLAVHATQKDLEADLSVTLSQ
jgi:hypothetical protein